MTAAYACVRCHSQIIAPQICLYIGILHLSSLQVQHDLTDHCTTGRLGKATCISAASLLFVYRSECPWSLSCWSCLHMMLGGFHGVSEVPEHWCSLWGALHPSQATLSFCCPLFYSSTNKMEVPHKISFPLTLKRIMLTNIH